MKSFGVPLLDLEGYNAILDYSVMFLHTLLFSLFGRWMHADCSRDPEWSNSTSKLTAATLFSP